MRGKFEDKVARLAFGELSPEDAAMIEREVHSDPEAVRALSLYKEMREGLRSMSDVPEDQFSKERLRDAILTQGLRPVPTRPISNRSWLWMPAMACALGFGIMFSRNMMQKPRGGPQLVLSDNISGLAVTPEPPITMVSRADVGSKYGPFAPPKAAKSEKPDVAGVVKDPNEQDPAILALMPSDDAYDPDLGQLPPTGSASAGAVTPVANKTPTSGASASPSGPIVLIDQDTDEQTGACRATEVGSSSNVLVGG